jgi:hypothetical protein
VESALKLCHHLNSAAESLPDYEMEGSCGASAGTVSCCDDPDFVPSRLPEKWQSKGAAWVQQQLLKQQQLSGGHLTVPQPSLGSVHSKHEPPDWWVCSVNSYRLHHVEHARCKH